MNYYHDYSFDQRAAFWTVEDRSKFFEGFSQHGENFRIISKQFVKTKSVCQCRTFFKNYCKNSRTPVSSSSLLTGRVQRTNRPPSLLTGKIVKFSVNTKPPEKSESNYHRWTNDKIEKLFQGVFTYGYQWEKIGEQFFKDIPFSKVSAKWFKLQEKEKSVFSEGEKKYLERHIVKLSIPTNYSGSWVELYKRCLHEQMEAGLRSEKFSLVLGGGSLNLEKVENSTYDRAGRAEAEHSVDECVSLNVADYLTEEYK